MNSSIVINKILELNYKGFKEAYIRQIEDGYKPTNGFFSLCDLKIA